MRIRLLFKLSLLVVALVGVNALSERASAHIHSASSAIENIAARNA